MKCEDCPYREFFKWYFQFLSEPPHDERLKFRVIKATADRVPIEVAKKVLGAVEVTENESNG